MSSKRRKSAPPSKVCPSPDSSPVQADSMQNLLKLDNESGILNNYHHLENFENEFELDVQENPSSASESEFELSGRCARQLNTLNRPLCEIIKSCAINGFKEHSNKACEMEDQTNEQMDKGTILLAQKRLNQIIEQLDKLRQRFMEAPSTEWKVSSIGLLIYKKNFLVAL